MNRAKIFITFTFLLGFVIQISSQNTVPSKNMNNSEPTNNLKQVSSSPNELKGYEFIKKGKLNQLRLGASTRENVRNIIGETCENGCIYESNWTIQIDYFDEDLTVIEKTYNKNQDKYTEKQYVPTKEAIGKILSISFAPKKRISFTNTAFSNQFNKYPYFEPNYATSDKNDGISFDIYTDSYGLQYWIFDKVVGTIHKDKSEFQKGDLISIKYTIPQELENQFFVEQK